MGTAIKASGYKQLCYNFATPDFLLFLFLIKKKKRLKSSHKNHPGFTQMKLYGSEQ